MIELLFLLFAGAQCAAAPAPLLTEAQHLRVEQITSIFENSTTDFQYAYIEDIEDGAGITAGRVGFNSNNGALLELTEAYAKARPGNGLERYIPCLRALKGRGDYACLFPSVSSAALAAKDFKSKGLLAAGFGLAFEEAAKDPVFRRTQDELVENDIYKPALAAAARLHVRSALGVAMIYDTAVQTGYGRPMGIDGIVSRMDSRPKDEAAWLEAYIRSRLDTLQHPFRPDGTRFEKPDYDTVPRAMALAEILMSKNYDLSGTVRFHYFGDTFEIK